MDQHEEPIGGPTRDALVDALARTAFATMAVLNRVGAEHDLSLTQLRVLAILRGRRLRMSALADFLGLERSTLTGLVDRAERRGLVARAPSPDDRRATEVYLTDAGVELGERIGPQVASALSGLTGRLGGDERDALRGLLERLSLDEPGGVGPGGPASGGPGSGGSGRSASSFAGLS